MKSDTPSKRWQGKRYTGIVRGRPLTVNITADGRVALERLAQETGWMRSDIVEHLIRTAKPSRFK